MNTIYTTYSHRFLLFITSFLSTYQLSYSADTLNNSQILKDDNSTTLVSSGGHFELGFFSPDNSKNRYVGIWYKRTSQRTVVWVGNRDNPLTGEKGTLTVVQPGILALQNGTGGIIWSTNTSRTVQTPVAQLLDSGNLVVKDANDNGPDNFLWQSFDHPTDTTLPGMKLGVNFQTGREVYTTSWKNSGDPALGDYTYHCDPTGYPQNVVKRGGALLYSSGPWNGVGFSGVTKLKKNAIFTFGMVINLNEVYYHYQLLDDSVYSRYTISDDGHGKRWIWEYQKQSWMDYVTVPIDGCDAYNVCGQHGRCYIENTYIENTQSCECLKKFKPKDPQAWENGNWSDGCDRSTPLNCENGDGFKRYSGIKLPNTRLSWYNITMTLDECKALCSNNCSCMAYASLNASGDKSGCLHWFGELVDIREMTNGQEIFIRLASSELDMEGGKRNILIVILSVVIGILLLSLGLLLYLQKRKKLNYQMRETSMTDEMLCN